MCRGIVKKDCSGCIDEGTRDCLAGKHSGALQRNRFLDEAGVARCCGTRPKPSTISRRGLSLVRLKAATTSLLLLCKISPSSLAVFSCPLFYSSHSLIKTLQAVAVLRFLSYPPSRLKVKESLNTPEGEVTGRAPSSHKTCPRTRWVVASPLMVDQTTQWPNSDSAKDHAPCATTTCYAGEKKSREKPGCRTTDRHQAGRRPETTPALAPPSSASHMGDPR